jgi:Domain of unknown function (DUF5615)
VKARFQADADLDRRIVRATRRREQAISFQLATEARSGVGLADLPDDQVLAAAASEGRILVSHDRRSMPQHFAHFMSAATSPGVIIVPQTMPLGVAVEWLVTIWSASEAEEWVNQILLLQK